MRTDQHTCPAPRSRVVELYFMEHRAKLLDIAAFLDRLDRARDDLDREDFRVAAFREALRILGDGRPERARRVLELLSDPTSQPIRSAAGMKGAYGAWSGSAGGKGRP
jgi:hypothetical protein